MGEKCAQSQPCGLDATRHSSGLDAETSAPRERPILFSAPMVRAILEGRKTQTRRIVKGIALDWLAPDMFTPEFVADPGNHLCPYGVPGDRLWVRERWASWMFAPVLPGYGGKISRDPGDWLYAATDPEWDAMMHDRRALADCNKRSEDGRTGNYVVRNSIHMPRWASRITLEITDVRVERLNDCSPDDAKAEGLEWVAPTYGIGDIAETWSADPVAAYRALWEHINGPGSWDANPWVWVVGFKPVAARNASPQGNSGSIS